MSAPSALQCAASKALQVAARQIERPCIVTGHQRSRISDQTSMGR